MAFLRVAVFLALAAGALAQTPGLFDSSSVAGARQNEMDRRASIAAALTYDTGIVILGQGLATLHLPEGYRYLNPVDADRLLSEIWGAVPGDFTLGLIVPPGVTVTHDEAWWVLLRYDTLGHVDDGNGLPDPDALMKYHMEVEETRNVDRMGANNPRKDILGWGVRPAYDPAHRTLHWAVESRLAWWDGKAFQYASSQLEYQVRILGRRGMIRMEAGVGAGRRQDLRTAMAPLLAAVAFQPGFRYSDFDPSVDKEADMELAGLITGLPLETPEYVKTLGWMALGIFALGVMRGVVKARADRGASSDPRAGSG